MAILAQKINLYSNAVNNTELANIYTTQAEMIPNKPNLPVTAGGINGFVQLDDVGAVNGTRGRVSRNSDGKTYQICNQAVVPYGQQAYTTPGKYTFTVPAGISKIRVAVCGGGGGWAGNYNNDPGQYNVGSGGTSSFSNLMSATGGGNCYDYLDTSGNDSWGYTSVYGFTGSPNGTFLSQHGWSLGFTFAHGDYGAGKDMAGGGGYNSGYINATAGATHQVTVGNAGMPNGSHKGKSGFVLVAWGGDIK